MLFAGARQPEYSFVPPLETYVADSRPIGRHMPSRHRARKRGRFSHLQLNAALEELGIASEVEAVKVSVTVVDLQAHVFG